MACEGLGLIGIVMYDEALGYLGTKHTHVKIVSCRDWCLGRPCVKIEPAWEQCSNELGGIFMPAADTSVSDI